MKHRDFGCALIIALFGIMTALPEEGSLLEWIISSSLSLDKFFFLLFSAFF